MTPIYHRHLSKQPSEQQETRQDGCAPATRSQIGLQNLGGFVVHLNLQPPYPDERMYDCIKFIICSTASVHEGLNQLCECGDTKVQAFLLSFQRRTHPGQMERPIRIPNR